MSRSAAAMVFATALALMARSAPAEMRPYRLDPSASVIAVLTHKAGLAARLAHDHLIVAPLAAASLALDPAAPERASFQVAVRAEALEVDPAAARARWAPRLGELGALPAGELPAVAPGDGIKVRQAMLDTGQLDAARHPEITVELLSITRRGGESARVALAWTARVRITVRGRAVEVDAPLRYELAADGTLEAEALGELRFTDFGIPPYRAMLGAVQNADLFHLFLHLKATPDAAAGSEP